MKLFRWRNVLIYGKQTSLLEQLIGTMALAGVVLLWCWQVSA